MNISTEFTGRIARIIFVFTLISSGPTSPAYAQYQEFEEIRKLENGLWLIRDEKDLTERYLDLAHRYVYVDSLKADEYSKKYLQLVEKNRDSVGIGVYYYDHAILYYYANDYVKAMEASRTCMRFTRDRDLFTFLEVSQVLIKSLFNLNRPYEAEQEGLKIIAEERYMSRPIQVAKVYYNLGLVTMYLRKDSAIQHFYKAVSLLAHEPENRVLLHCFHNMSLYYRDQNKYDSAFRYAERAYRLAQDRSLYNNADYISPANNYQFLLSYFGHVRKAQEVWRDLQVRQYDLKVKSIMFPEISRRIGYLEYLSFGEKMRFIVLLIIAVAILIFLVSLVVFIRKLRRKQAELSASLELNNVLIQETNHRVKNNFQIMMSMLNVHAGDAAGSLSQFIEHTRARIASMARVHDMFLQNATVGTTDVREFFQEIFDSLKTSLDLTKKGINIRFETEVSQLDSAKIITLGLIINELVVNSVKYAFPGSKGGEISLSLNQAFKGFILTYRDNGSGIQAAGEQESGSGMSIVSSLARRLGGEANLRSDQGTCMEIRFEA